MILLLRGREIFSGKGKWIKIFIAYAADDINFSLIGRQSVAGLTDAGTIKTFIQFKNYGWIRSDYDRKEVFFHSSAANPADQSKIEPGASVEFERIESSRGPRAEKLRFF